MSSIKSTLTLIAFPEIFPFNNNKIMIRKDNTIEYQRKRFHLKKNDEEISLNPNRKLLNEVYNIPD